MKRYIVLSLILTVAGFTFRVRAASIGDPAPPLSIERWIKGTPATLGQGKNLLVVEFWATWCGSCKRSIPHLTELQKKYAGKGVVFLGVSDEPVAVVTPFVASQGDNMAYHVATDSSKRTFNAWMTAFGESGIPHAFIVATNGTVVWHDYPNARLDKALEALLAGRYDMDFARNAEAGDRLVRHYTKLVLKPNATTNAAPVGEKIVSEFSRDWRIPCRLAKTILTDPQVRSRDVALALRAATKAAELTHERSHQPLEMRARALYASGRRSEAITELKKSVALCEDSEDLRDLQKLLAMYERVAQTTASEPK